MPIIRSPVSDGSANEPWPVFVIPPKILVVEDVPAIQIVNREFLKILGCTVEVVGTGLEAVQMAQAPYALVLLDIGLPDISGLEVAQKIRANERLQAGAPKILIALTSFGSVVCKECMAAGCDDFYIKPMSLDLLAKILKRWLVSYLKD